MDGLRSSMRLGSSHLILSLLSLCLSVVQTGSATAADRSSASPHDTAATGWIVRETSLGPAGDEVAVSPDGRHVARIIRRGKKERVLRDQTESPEYESVRGLLFGPDSRRLAYIVKQKAGPRLVVDGQEVATVDGVYPLVGFTRKGDRWFALTAEGFVVEGVQEPLVRGRRGYDPWEWGPACISQDGTRFGFVHWPMKEPRELVVHGPLGEELHREVGPRRNAKFLFGCFGCDFSPDGQHLAYSVLLHAAHAVDALFGSHTSCRLMLDDVPIGEGNLKRPVFSHDSARLAFPVKRAGKWYVVVHGGREEGAYDDIEDGWDGWNGPGPEAPLFFSPDSKRLAYGAKKEGQWFAVVDGTPGEPYEKLGRPIFSPDSSRVVYRAKKQGKWVVVADGRPGKPYDSIGPDRRQFRWEPSFSPDGRRIAYGAKSGGNWFAVVDGKDGPAYDEVASLAFSPDSRHLAYAARRRDEWVLVVDGVEGRAFDSLPDRTVAFDGPRQLHTLIERGGEYLLLEVEIPSS